MFIFTARLHSIAILYRMWHSVCWCCYCCRCCDHTVDNFILCACINEGLAILCALTMHLKQIKSDIFAIQSNWTECICSVNFTVNMSLSYWNIWTISNLFLLPTEIQPTEQLSVKSYFEFNLRFYFLFIRISKMFRMIFKYLNLKMDICWTEVLFLSGIIGVFKTIFLHPDYM